MAQRLIHRAKLFYFPADGHYEIRCIDCNITLTDNPLDPETVFYIPGECQFEPKIGIETSDGIGIEDKMG